MDLHGKYIDKLNSLPAPGGNGCHPALLGAATLGLMAGVSAEEIFLNIRDAIPAGKRRISDREIQDALHRAISDTGAPLPAGERFKSHAPQKAKPVVDDGKAMLQTLIKQSNICDEVDLWELSPHRIDWEPLNDPVNFLMAMFEPEDLLFIGECEEPGIVGQNIRSQMDWIKYFQASGKTMPFIIVNPLTGKAAAKKSGAGETCRGDGNVKSFRYCLVEFDNLTRDEQIRFWTSRTVKELPVSALIDTGGKSIHAWIRTDNINTLDDWQREIRQGFYEKSLIPLGVDSACINPARLSRLPGHFRDTGKYQRILWLNTEKAGNL